MVHGFNQSVLEPKISQFSLSWIAIFDMSSFQYVLEQVSNVTVSEKKTGLSL